MNFFKKIMGLTKETKNAINSEGVSLSGEKTTTVQTESPAEKTEKKDESSKNNSDDTKTDDNKNSKNDSAAPEKQNKDENIKKQGEQPISESSDISDTKQYDEAPADNYDQTDIDDDYLNKEITANFDDNINYIIKRIGNSYDLIFRQLTLVNRYQEIKIAIYYLAGMADNTLVYDALTETITENFRYVDGKLKTSQEILDYFDKTNLTIGSVKKVNFYGELFNSLLSGDVILLIEGINSVFLLGARGHKERAVEKPSTHTTVKGANDSFNETLLTNITLIRRRIKTPNLWVKNYILGEKSNTNCAMIYIKGVASEQVIKEVDQRIKENPAESILDTTYLVKIIKDKQTTIFPTIYETERPDIAAANLFEGRVILLVDGTPFAIVVPSLLVQSIQSVEDYFQKATIATFFRFIRFGAFIVAIYFPALYICFIHYHSELLPLPLLFNIIGQRLEVPFPSFLEILLMLIGFDLLRESGTRMPAPLGSALSFLGAIIIGQSAVSAGLFSSIIVIVVTVTGICTLALPGYSLNLTITVLRYFVLLAAAFFGFFGIMLATIALLTHLTSLRSFGVSYLAPFSPFSASALKDYLIRTPMGKIFHRKKNISSALPH